MACSAVTSPAALSLPGLSRALAASCMNANLHRPSDRSEGDRPQILRSALAGHNWKRSGRTRTGNRDFLVWKLRSKLLLFRCVSLSGRFVCCPAWRSATCRTLRTVITVHGGCFPEQHRPVGLCSGDLHFTYIKFRFQTVKILICHKAQPAKHGSEPSAPAASRDCD
jgi:hypothetical protein